MIKYDGGLGVISTRVESGLLALLVDHNISALTEESETLPFCVIYDLGVFSSERRIGPNKEKGKKKEKKLSSLI